VSGTKASNQQRTSKKAAEFILRQRVAVGGAYGQGWNQACEALAAQIAAGAHLESPPKVVPQARAVGKSEHAVGKSDHAIAGSLGRTTAAGTVLQPRADGGVTAARCGKDGCIHQAGHVELGQPLHSDGGRTWRDRK